MSMTMIRPIKLLRKVIVSLGSYSRAVHSDNDIAFPVLSDTLVYHDIETTSKKKCQTIMQYHEHIKKLCFDGGGEKGRTLHTVKNKKILPRERLRAVFDDGSEALELCIQAGVGMEYGDIPGATSVIAIGQVHGQYCLVAANDATLKGGSFFPVTVKKSLRSQEISRLNLLPAIYLVDSGGGFLPLQSEFFADKMHGGRSFYNQAVDGSQGVPQLAMVCGSCTAGGAYVPMMCDDAAIVHRIGTVFLGGPPLVKAATGEDISAENLGGATVHCNVSGCTDYFCATEKEVFEVLRDAVATLDISPPPTKGKPNEPLYDQSQLDAMCGVESICNSRMMGVISRLVDGSRFREFKKNYGKNLVTGYAFIDRMRVGIVANCGALSYEDGLKGAHFTQICDQRNIPIVFLQNSGPSDEYWSLMSELPADDSFQAMKGRAAMIGAVSSSRVPKVSINIGGCHGDDNYTMCGPSFGPNFLFCWPGSETTLQPLGSTEKTTSNVPESAKKKIKSKSAFDFASQSSWFMASRVLNDGIISPSETRKVIVHCLRIFEQKQRINCREIVNPIYRF